MIGDTHKNTMNDQACGLGKKKLEDHVEFMGIG